MNRLLDSIKQTVRAQMRIIAVFLNKISGGKITPNMITITGLVAHFSIAYLIARQSFIWAGLFLIIFGLFDALDGALARVQGSTNKKGMLLDSVTDRVKEVALYTGIAYAFISMGNAYFAVWAVIACGISVIVSYINAWGEVVIKENKTKDHATNKSFRAGFMTFEVRMLTLIIGLLTGYLEVSVVFIAVFALLTAIERFRLITQKL